MIKGFALNDESDNTKAGICWLWLEHKLKQYVFQFVSGTHWFKFEALVEKLSKDDVLNWDDFILLAKH